MVASRESHSNKGARLADLANQMRLMRGLESSPQPELNLERGKARLPLLMESLPFKLPCVAARTQAPLRPPFVLSLLPLIVYFLASTHSTFSFPPPHK